MGSHCTVQCEDYPLVNLPLYPHAFKTVKLNESQQWESTVLCTLEDYLDYQVDSVGMYNYTC